MKTKLNLISILLLTLSLEFSHQKFENILYDSLKNYEAFEQYWNYLYRKGSDHNGSARMVGDSKDHSHIYLENRTIVLKATKVKGDVGKSSCYPYLPIHYYSGAIHSKLQIVVNDKYPEYEIKGQFKAPIQPGTWPAFWLTGAETWPPEIDILEFKGNNVNWFNTFRAKDDIQTYKLTLDDKWHEYRIYMKKFSKTDVVIYFSVDGNTKAKHIANFVGKPLYIIMNLQMEGGSKGTPPKEAYFYGRSIYVGRENKDLK